MPPPPPGAPRPFALSDEGALERLAREVGLEPETVEDVPCVWEYADLEPAVRGLMASGSATMAMRNGGEEQVQKALEQVIAQFRQKGGRSG